MKSKSQRSRKQRRMTALLVIILVLLVALQGRSLWIKVTHPFKYEETIRQYAMEYHLDPMLVAAVVNVESKFDLKAESSKGAKGLMQIMDDTAVWGAEKIGIEEFETEQLYTPETNIRIGCWYLARLLDQYHGDKAVALAAYNGGSGNVSKWLQDAALSKDGKSLTAIPFPETEAYVERVLEQEGRYRQLYEK